MTRYVALVDRDEDQVGFSFPGLPGCAAQASGFDDAYDAAIDALAEWISDEAAEGRHHPARTLNEVFADQNVQIAVGHGAAVAFVPLVRMTGRTTKANLSLDEGLLAEIDSAAASRGVTRSTWMTSAAREALRRET